MKVFNIKSIMTMILIIFLISSCLVFYPAEYIGAESETRGRIAYVDLWAVFNSHPEKVVAENELNQLAQSMQAELEEGAKGLASDEQQELLKEYQGRLTQREQELIQSIIDSIKNVVIQLAEEKEVNMVLEKTNVIYGGYDITEDVIIFINKNNKEENIEDEDSQIIETPELSVEDFNEIESEGTLNTEDDISIDESDSAE